MRKHLKRIGAVVILLLGICILMALAANNVHENYNVKRKVIIRQCEEAMPVVIRRYQSFIPLLALCEKQDTWTDSFETYTEPPLPSFLKNGEGQPDENPENKHTDLKRFTGRIIVKKAVVNRNNNYGSFLDAQAFGTGSPAEMVTNFDVGVDVIVDFAALHDGVIRFTTGSTAFEKVMGATEIEANLPQIITAATNFDAINSNELMRQVKIDLAATDPAATAALSAVSELVEQYNFEIAHSRFAQMMTMPPIAIDSKLVIWEAGKQPN